MLPESIAADLSRHYPPEEARQIVAAASEAQATLNKFPPAIATAAACVLARVIDASLAANGINRPTVGQN